MLIALWDAEANFTFYATLLSSLPVLGKRILKIGHQWEKLVMGNHYPSPA